VAWYADAAEIRRGFQALKSTWQHTGAAALICVFTTAMAAAQATSLESCRLDPPAFSTGAPNIFNDRQEQDLGDALAEYAESDMRIAAPAEDDQLTQIGERLLATLPPTGVHYRFRIYDSGEINGFSLAGGRVYISRKLIASVKNEDELAGVLAHEIGHLSTHQVAIEFTRLFKIRLGVTQVGDRADVFAKVHQFMSTPAKDNEPEENEEKDQLVADHVALYAMVRAGYAPGSFAAFLNASMMNKSKTGNWFTDVFGLTHEASKRYREATKLIAELPAGCQDKQPQAGLAFLAWQKKLLEQRVQLIAEGAVGDETLKLKDPVRPTAWRVRFSPDGNYVLMQDEGSITVAGVKPPRYLFRIDAPDVQAAKFTPDSQEIVFNDDQLRVERWNIFGAKRVDVKEMVVFDGCSQSLLSADGRTLVCAKVDLDHDQPRIGLRILDVATGSTLYENQKFFELNAMSSYWTYLSFFTDAITGTDMVTMLSSPDGKYLLAVVGQSIMGYDFTSRQPVQLGGKLKGLVQSPMSFVGPDKLYVVDRNSDKGMHPARMLSFPDGRVLNESKVGEQVPGSVTQGELLSMSPLKDYAVGLYDPVAAKIVCVWRSPAIDAWNKRVAAEDSDGNLFLGVLDSQDAVRMPVPLGPLPSPQAGEFSPDGRYLAVSLRGRSAVWDLATGAQVRLMRPLRNIWIDNQDRLFGQFPKYMDRDPAEFELDLKALQAKDLGKFEDGDQLYRNLQISLRPMGRDKATNRHVTLEVRNMETQAVAWSRDYPGARPVCWPAEDDRMVLGWDLGSDTAKSELKGNPKLQQLAASFKDHKKGLLIETVKPETGAPLEQVALPEVDLSNGWDDERFAQVSGEFALVRGEHNNTVIYRLDTGAKAGEFFGWPVATDAEMGLIAATNREDEIVLVNERTGTEIERFTLGSPLRLARIIASQRQLLVLTADQVVHRIPLPGAAPAPEHSATAATPGPTRSSSPPHPAS
jgi:Peptidase family M48